MGLFSKKTIVCESCGREYEARFTLGRQLCKECLTKVNAMSDCVKGYVDYNYALRRPEFTQEELIKVREHRDAILNKYRMSDGISKADLQYASDNYKKLTKEEAANVVMRIMNSTINSTCGAAYTESFFIPTQYERTIVDVKDVFAVGYTSDYKHEAENGEVILCVVFTNDPYIPVFPMGYIGKKGFFEIMKSKKGRQGVEALFESLCPNLTYPVCDIKQLKKMIKEENVIKGNLDKQFMLDKISDASYCTGILNTKKLHSDLYPSTTQMLDEYGYIQDSQIDSILRMDKMFNRNFWNKQIDLLIQNNS